MRKVTVETTTGMMMSIERFNALSEIEEANTVVPSGVRLVILRNGEESGFIVSPDSTLGQVFCAWVQLFGEIGRTYELLGIRNSVGILLETRRMISEYGFKPWERLFIDVLEKEAKNG